MEKTNSSSSFSDCFSSSCLFPPLALFFSCSEKTTVEETTEEAAKVRKPLLGMLGQTGESTGYTGTVDWFHWDRGVSGLVTLGHTLMQ